MIGLEPIEFERAMTIFRPSKQVLSQAVANFKRFRENNELAPGTVSCLAQISVFVAEASQEIKDLKGRKYSQIGLSMSRLLGHCACLGSTLLMLDQFIKYVCVDEQNRTEIQQHLSRAQSSYDFMIQFEEYMSQLQLIVADTNPNSEYSEVFIELAWMLYIDSKQNYLKSDFFTNSHQIQICLLASICYFMIRYSLDYIYPAQLRDQRNLQKRTMVGRILQFVLDAFHISNIELYKNIALKFDDYAYKLINEFIFRAVGADTDFFSPLIIHFNFKQIQNRYQKTLKPKDLDFRVFRRQYSITPIHKEALFYRVGKAKQGNLTKSMTRDYKSHRMLQYDDQQISHVVSVSNPEKVGKAISRHQASLYGSVPQAVNLQIYRYIKTLAKSSRKLSPVKKQSIQKAIKEMATQIQSDSTLSRESLELTVYWLYEALQTHIQYSSNSEQVSLCSLALSFYIVEQMYYQRCPLKLVISYIEGASSQTLISVWSCLSSLVDLPIKMPAFLLRQFEAQKEEITSCLVWQYDGFIDQLAELAANFHKQPSFVNFCDNLIQYAETFLTKLARALQTPSEVCTYAYNCFKFILSSNGTLLKNRHIDQILICSVYIGGKISSNQVLFAEIKQKYEVINQESSTKPESVFNEVLLEQNQIGDIIAFYNTQFLRNIQPFVPYMRNPSLSLFHPLFQRQISTSENFDNNRILMTTSNLLLTQKPKHPHTKSNNEISNRNIGIFIQAQRNQTRVRIRPPTLTNSQLCHTEKDRYQYQPEQISDDQS